MNREREGKVEAVFVGCFGVSFAPSDGQRQAGITEEQLSAPVEDQYPPQGIENKPVRSVPIWPRDARILTGRGLAEIGNALGSGRAGG